MERCGRQTEPVAVLPVVERMQRWWWVRVSVKPISRQVNRTEANDFSP